MSSGCVALFVAAGFVRLCLVAADVNVVADLHILADVNIRRLGVIVIVRIVVSRGGVTRTDTFESAQHGVVAVEQSECRLAHPPVVADDEIVIAQPVRLE